MITLRVGGFFSGIGAHISACERLKDRTKFVYVFQCECDEKTAVAYNDLHGETLNLGDITQVDNIGGVNKIDILFWTPPCQDISKIGPGFGNKKNSGTRSALAFEIPRILKNTPEEDRPKYLVMEEVAYMLNKKYLGNFKNLIRELAKIGYNSNYGLMNAYDYGIPQNRNRCFMVSCYKSPAPNMPKPIPLDTNLGNYLDTGLIGESYYLTPDCIKWYQDHNKKLESRGIHYRFEPKDKQGIANTILTKEGNRTTSTYVIDGERVRRLTEAEALRLQGYTNEEVGRLLNITTKTGRRKHSKTAIYRYAGNSVCVTCFQSILTQILNDIERPKRTLDFWLDFTTKNYTPADVGK